MQAYVDFLSHLLHCSWPINLLTNIAQFSPSSLSLSLSLSLVSQFSLISFYVDASTDWPKHVLVFNPQHWPGPKRPITGAYASQSTLSIFLCSKSWLECIHKSPGKERGDLSSKEEKARRDDAGGHGGETFTSLSSRHALPYPRLDRIWPHQDRQFSLRPHRPSLQWLTPSGGKNWRVTTHSFSQNDVT